VTFPLRWSMRPSQPTRFPCVVAVVLLAVVIALPWGRDVHSADHRDAPLSSEDPTADINDVYVFVNPQDSTKVIFAMTVNGFAVPAVQSSYSFGTDVLYQFKIDTNGDAREDLVVQATFDGFESLRDPRCATAAGGQFVTVIGPAKPSVTGAANFLLKKGPDVGGCTNTVLSGDGLRVWAGLADDPFVVDIGQLNRILGNTQDLFRQTTSPVLGPLRGREIRADGTSGVDGFGGFNTSALVVEVPISMILPAAATTVLSPQHGGGRLKPRTERGYLGNDTTIGVWGTTSRSKVQVRSPRREPRDVGPYVQVQRMGHQVFKTIFVPGPSKDPFNRSVPADDARNVSQFIPDALTTADNDDTGNTIAGRAAVLDLVGVTAPPNGVPLLLPPGFANTDKNLLRRVLIPDVLRINLALPATDVGVASNGLQNGRRFGDDVIDILLRLARQLADVKFPDGAGVPGSGPLGTRKALDCSALPACPDRRVLAVLQGTDFIKPDAELGDLGTSSNDRPFRTEFPFIGLPHPLPGSDTPPPGTVGFPPQQ
jgi:uncharacterized protein DUF4331